MARTLVTGAAGFIGFHVAARLLDDGHEVVGLDNLNDYYDVRLKRARHLDATVLEALRRVAVELRATDQTLILCGLTDQIAALLSRSELAEARGEEGLRRAGPRLMEGYERAVQRASERLRPLDDAQIFRHEEAAAWSYEI